MATYSELQSLSGAGEKTLEITSSTPHSEITMLNGVSLYNGTSGDIEVTVSMASSGSGGYKIVDKITVTSETSKRIGGRWPITDSSDKYKAVWTQGGGNVNVTYRWTD